MPFSGSNMDTVLKGAMLSAGLTGSQSSKFTKAISNGSQLAVVGKSFSTTDIGLVVGAGPSVGSGTGITIDDGVVKSAIMAKALGLGLTGQDFEKIASATAKAFVAEMKLVTLTSTHSPVFEGNGTIIPGSVTISGSEIGSNAFKLGIGLGLAGQDFEKVANAIGFGFGEGIKIGVGKVKITGSPVPPPPPPAPGAGSSISGVIS